MSNDNIADQIAAELHGAPLLVHREGLEGALVIDSLNGRILTPMDERPDWSEGLAVARLSERVSFYQTRLAPEDASRILALNPIEYRDLAWVGADAAGDEMHVEADTEYRMDVIAEVTGHVRTDDIDDAAQYEDVPGQTAYVVLDESHEYKAAAGEEKIVSRTWEEKLADAAATSERELHNGTHG